MMHRRHATLGTSAIAWLGGHWRASAAIVLAATLALGYLFSPGDSLTAKTSEPAPQGHSGGWYTCSMHPQVRMPKADDRCPICHMSLIPVPAGASLPEGVAADASGTPALSAAAQALMEVQTTPVVRRFIRQRVRMVGRVDYDETRLAYITAYVAGRLDRLFVDYTGINVRPGDHMAEVYSPGLLVVRQELMQARRTLDQIGADAGGPARAAAESILTAARERLRLLGLSAQQIAAAESGSPAQNDRASDHITLHAPIGGVVIEKNARQGSYVKEGDRIYTIVDLTQVWVMLEAYESDLPWLRYGQKARFTTASYGDETFEGTIAFIAPTLDPRKRTVQVRVNVANADGRLRPGMLVRAAVIAQVAAGGRVIAPELAGKWLCPMHPEVVREKAGQCPVCGMDLVRAEELGYASVGQAGDGSEGDAVQAPLVVPESAVLRTGQRGVVYVKEPGDGGSDASIFRGREVELGPRGEGFFIVRSGLREGELVVTRGGFQIDSALQIQARPSMMSPAPAPAPGSEGGEQ